MRIGIIVLGAVSLACAQTAPAPECGLVDGWEQEGQERAFTGDNLFEYMDGNAEGYLIYGFVKMTGVTCTRGGVDLVMDISEMGDADSSYGLFATNRDPRRPVERIGAGGQIQPRRAIFVRNASVWEIRQIRSGAFGSALPISLSAIQRARRTFPRSKISYRGSLLLLRPVMSRSSRSETIRMG